MVVSSDIYYVICGTWFLWCVALLVAELATIRREDVRLEEIHDDDDETCITLTLTTKQRYINIYKSTSTHVFSVHLVLGDSTPAKCSRLQLLKPTDRYATGPSSRMEAAVCDRDNTDPCLFSCDPASSPQDIPDVCQLLVISVSLQSLQEETQLCEVYINPDPDH